MSRKVTITVKAQDLGEVLKNLETEEGFIEDSLFTLDVVMKDTKNNYQYLSTSDKIVDWSLDNEVEKNNEEEVKKEIPNQRTTEKSNNTKENIESKVKDSTSTSESECKCSNLADNACKTEKNNINEKGAGIIGKDGGFCGSDIEAIIYIFTNLQKYPVNNEEGICRLIDAVFNVKQVSPEFRFSERVFEQRVLSEYISLSLGREYPEPLVNIIASYYAGNVSGICGMLKDVLIKLKYYWNSINNCSTLGEVILKLFKTTDGYAIRFFG